jgi:hypothetical protein
MKNLHRTLEIFFSLAFFLITRNAGAQSVSIDKISGLRFCLGDHISVTFTATGHWDQGNVFILQLSDATGSFSNGFVKLGSLSDTLPGTFTIDTIIPNNVYQSTRYRLRILAVVPYTTSADNGSDIAIGTGPYANFTSKVKDGSTGTPMVFSGGSGLHDTAFWDFGLGATPAKAISTDSIGVETGVDIHGKPTYDTVGSYLPQYVTYSTTGDKTVTLSIGSTGGCYATVTHKFHIYDCSKPSIPHDAIVINADTTVWQSGTYWVNPGFTFTSQGTDTIFAESGSTIIGGYDIDYMKPGSMFTSGSVTYIDSGSITSTNPTTFTLHCPTLDFDYTNAPHNPAFPSASVKNDLNSISLTLSPNPTSGMLHIQGLPSDNVTLSVFNVLGETVLAQKRPTASDFTLDLSSLVAGTYYVRFSSLSSVVTKKVVRE